MAPARGGAPAEPRAVASVGAPKPPSPARWLRLCPGPFLCLFGRLTYLLGSYIIFLFKLYNSSAIPPMTSRTPAQLRADALRRAAQQESDNRSVAGFVASLNQQRSQSALLGQSSGLGKQELDAKHIAAAVASVPTVGGPLASPETRKLGIDGVSRSQGSSIYAISPQVVSINAKTLFPISTSEDAKKALALYCDHSVPHPFGWNAVRDSVMSIQELAEEWEKEFLLPEVGDAHFAPMGADKWLIWARDPGCLQEIECEYLQACQRAYIGLCMALKVLRETHALQPSGPALIDTLRAHTASAAPPSATPAAPAAAPPAPPPAAVAIGEAKTQ